MARILHHQTYAASRAFTNPDFGSLMLLAMQAAIFGGIGLVILVAIVNSILGTPQQEAGYSPYR